jgi:aryl-alcohol dehydrogenase-like predicted oxidoreductase
MERLPIPRSSASIARLGFGCARIFGGSEIRSSRKLIEAALDYGITHFDTAPAYGSEDVLGSVLAGVRGVTITTKIGLPRFSENASSTRRFAGSFYRRTLRPILARFPTVKSRLLRATSQGAVNVSPTPKRRLSRDVVLRELEDSLRRLRRSSVDLYLLHEPATIEMTDELNETFVMLQRDGLVGAFGLAFGTVPSIHGAFGTVMQCRYPGATPGPPQSRFIPIYHGVVRFGLQHPREDRTQVAAARLIAQALKTHPECAVIFSASTIRQLAQVSDCVPHDSSRIDAPCR